MKQLKKGLQTILPGITWYLINFFSCEDIVGALALA
jgi:hypothetical protein